MSFRRLSASGSLALLLPLGACHVRPESLVPAGASSTAPPASEFLTREPQAFVVLGDELSFVWPALLEELLEMHAERHGLFPVLNASVAAPGVSAWTEECDEGPLQDLVEDYLAPEARLRKRGPLPRTALCLVSLRGLCDEAGPVKGEHDMLGAEMGANALERLALELVQHGIQRVVFATPIYAGDSGPEAALERLAIERLIARGHAFVEAGPDLFSATRHYHPDAYEPDGVHPNEFGLKLVAEEWYRWLAGPEAREPAVEALYSKEYDTDALEAAFVASRELARP